MPDLPSFHSNFSSPNLFGVPNSINNNPQAGFAQQQPLFNNNLLGGSGADSFNLSPPSTGDPFTDKVNQSLFQLGGLDGSGGLFGNNRILGGVVRNAIESNPNSAFRRTPAFNLISGVTSNTEAGKQDADRINALLGRGGSSGASPLPDLGLPGVRSTGNGESGSPGISNTSSQIRPQSQGGFSDSSINSLAPELAADVASLSKNDRDGTDGI